MNKRELIKSMISYLKKDSMNEGFCKAFWVAEGSFAYEGKLEPIMIKQIHELDRHKPNPCGRFWFPLDAKGKKKRIEILENILKEIE